MDTDNAAGAGPLNRSRDDIAAWLRQDAAGQAAVPTAPGAALPAAASQWVAGLALQALRSGVSARRPEATAAATLRLAGDTAQALLRPAAQAHPWTLVAVAALGGAALVAGRRWRWLLQPILINGVVAQLTAAARAPRPAAAAASPAARPAQDPPR